MNQTQVFRPRLQKGIGMELKTNDNIYVGVGDLDLWEMAGIE